MRPRTLILVGVGVLALAARLYLEVIPFGASVLPFYCASEVGPELRSPNGRVLQVYFNDAGGAHSGNYWTWVVERRFWGRVVVAEGYLGADVRYDASPVPVEWEREEPKVKFESGRR